MNTRRILGFCDLHTSPLIPNLNDRRALGSVTFLGRFAIMDFTLSNFTNSSIDTVCILAHRFPHSVLGHIQSGGAWTMNTKIGFENIFFNENGLNRPSWNTDINNIIANSNQLKNVIDSYDYVVVAPAHYLSSMDFRPIIDQHIKANSKITSVYVPIFDGKKNFTKSTLVTFNNDGSIKSFKRNSKIKDDINVSLDTFVISVDVFLDIINRAQKINKTFNISDMVNWLLKNENMRIDGYKFEHYVIPIMSLKDYVKNSFDLLKYENRRKLFRHDWPIYTRTHDTPPAKYLDNANVKDSIISNGCLINGRVEHSILSRNVVVEKGAVVTNSIIFTDSIIYKNCKVNHIITDKNVSISANIEGKEDEPVFVKSGNNNL